MASRHPATRLDPVAGCAEEERDPAASIAHDGGDSGHGSRVTEASLQIVVDGAVGYRADVDHRSAGTDCNDDANALSATRIARAEEKLIRRAENACAGGRREAASEPAALGFTSCPAPCDGIDIGNTFDGVVACLSCVAEAEIEALAGSVYGVPPLPVSRDAQRCQIRIARGASGYVANRGKAQERCQLNLDRARLPEGTDCQTHDPRGKAAKAQANAEKGIAKSCATSAVELDACGGDVATLEACVVDAARTAADALFDAVYRPLP